MPGRELTEMGRPTLNVGITIVAWLGFWRAENGGSEQDTSMHLFPPEALLFLLLHILSPTRHTQPGPHPSREATLSFPSWFLWLFALPLGSLSRGVAAVPGTLATETSSWLSQRDCPHQHLLDALSGQVNDTHYSPLVIYSFTLDCYIFNKLTHSKPKIRLQ